ncbi:hypothetical protein BJ917_0296 [Pseudomonas sp. WPR_5_2]|nr:hypothetical protein BJ917_0296 [Pseudomonas sp. WPR_5_2]
MKAFENQLTPVQERRLIGLESWHRVFGDSALRRERPDAYHEELLRQAVELDRLGIVIWEEWRDLRSKLILLTCVQ